MRLLVPVLHPSLVFLGMALLAALASSAKSTRAADRPASDAHLGRSPVLATRGMVATSQPLAAAAGLRVLQQGGNAVDAAVATAAVLNVVEPMMCGIGGDLFALVYWSETGELMGLNATGRAGALASAAKLRAKGLEHMPDDGILSVTVPGALDGWASLVERFGSRPLGELLQPAIRYAEEGFPVSDIIATSWKANETKLSRRPDSARTYLIDGKAPANGEIFKSPDLARTLKRIAEQGPEIFYRGRLAREIAEFVQGEGGLLTPEDFADHRSTWVEPISGTYRGVTLYEMPPNSQGFVALEMLNILEGFDIGSLGHQSVDTLHLIIEAKKLAFADRDAYLADPEKADVPVERLISKEYGAERRRLISRERAFPRFEPGLLDSTETVYVTVVDEDRNAVSLIYSLFSAFGSGVVVPDTGIMLQNRGSGFSLESGHPNEIAPGKRSLHTNMPAMAFRNGKPWLVFGVMGGDMQPQGQVQVLLNLIDFGVNVQEAGEAARFRHTDSGVAFESGFDVDVLHGLIQKGHRPITQFGVYGGYQAILIDPETGVLAGGSDPRKDGCAMGY